MKKEEIKEIFHFKGINSLTSSKYFLGTVIVLILINALALGIMSAPDARSILGGIFFNDISGIKVLILAYHLDQLCLILFIFEIMLRISGEHYKFFKKKWNIFDFTIIFLSAIPDIGLILGFDIFSLGLDFLGSLRILRVLRLLILIHYIIPTEKIHFILLKTFNASFPLILFMSLIFYVYAIIGVTLFGDVSIYFKSLGASSFTLLQILTLDGWASSIARPISVYHHFAWIYFSSYIFINLFIIINILACSISSLINTNQKK
jgi:voltage-gated sodium channel